MGRRRERAERGTCGRAAVRHARLHKSGPWQGEVPGAARSYLRARSGEEQQALGRLHQGRAFLPIIFSSLGGIGPPETVSWLDSIFSESYAEERLRTGTVRNTSHRHTLFYQSLMATLVSSSADMASQLTAAGAVDDGDDEVDAAQPLR